jgi:hypothetical protein
VQGAPCVTQRAAVPCGAEPSRAHRLRSMRMPVLCTVHGHHPTGHHPTGATSSRSGNTANTRPQRQSGNRRVQQRQCSAHALAQASRPAHL